MQILQRLTAVETKLDMQLNAKDIANEALQSAKAAHHRAEENRSRTEELDKHYDFEIKTLNSRVEIEVQKINARTESDNEKRKQGQRWLIGTLITSGGLIIATLTIILRMVGK
jgi:hypothetical protein